MKLAPIAAIVLVSAFMAAAHAQTADHSSCAPWKAKWSEVSKGADLAAIDDVIGKIPALCPNLKAEAVAGRADAARRIEQQQAEAAKKIEQAREAEAKQQAAIEAARRANDPCLQARNDWPIIQSASEATVKAYRDGLPAACGSWRVMASERLTVLERDRAAAEEKQRADNQQRAASQRIADLTAAAKASGIEGNWTSPSRNAPRSSSINIRVDTGRLIVSVGDGKGTAAYTITEVSENSVSVEQGRYSTLPTFWESKLCLRLQTPADGSSLSDEPSLIRCP